MVLSMVNVGLVKLKFVDFFEFVFSFRVDIVILVESWFILEDLVVW